MQHSLQLERLLQQYKWFSWSRPPLSKNYKSHTISFHVCSSVFRSVRWHNSKSIPGLDICGFVLLRLCHEISANYERYLTVHESSPSLCTPKSKYYTIMLETPPFKIAAIAVNVVCFAKSTIRQLPVRCLCSSRKRLHLRERFCRRKCLQKRSHWSLCFSWDCLWKVQQRPNVLSPTTWPGGYSWTIKFLLLSERFCILSFTANLKVRNSRTADRCGLSSSPQIEHLSQYA